MRITAECGCGANIVADSSGEDTMWVLDRVMKAVEEFKEAHKGCSALRATPAPAAPTRLWPTYTYHEPRFGHGGIPVPNSGNPKSGVSE